MASNLIPQEIIEPKIYLIRGHEEIAAIFEAIRQLMAPLLMSLREG